MSCCRPLKICNNSARVSAAWSCQEPQRCGWNWVVGRLSIKHRDHIWARFSLINDPSWSAYRLDQHCMPFEARLLFPCRRPCRGRVRCVCVCVICEREKERQRNWAREDNMSQWLFEFPYVLKMIGWSFTFRKYSHEEEEGGERSSLSLWETANTIWFLDCQFPSEYHHPNSKYNYRK